MPKNLPSIRCHSAKDASTLVVTMADIPSGIEVDLVYVVMHEHDAVTRRVVFRNVDDSPSKPSTCTRDRSKVVHKASSMTVDFEADILPFYLLQLGGSWGRERYIQENILSMIILTILVMCVTLMIQTILTIFMILTILAVIESSFTFNPLRN